MDIHNGTIHLDVTTLQFLVYTVLPFIVDLITKRFADGRIKAGLLTLLAALTALIQEGIQHNGDFDVPSLIGKFVTALVVAYLTHTYVWKPLRLTGDRGAVLKALPGGVGATDPAKVAAEAKRAGSHAA